MASSQLYWQCGHSHGTGQDYCRCDSVGGSLSLGRPAHSHILRGNVTEGIHVHSQGPGTDGSEDYGPLGNAQPESEPDWQVIFGAADYTTIVKPKSTATSREARDKTYSMLKALTFMAIQSGDLPDAAAILYHGPQFGVAVGQLAEADKRAKAAIDFLTSPSNPYLLFLFAAMGFGSQIWRNHEEGMKELPDKIRMSRQQRKMIRQASKNDPPRFTAHIFGRAIPIRFNPKVRLGAIFKGLRTQTREPKDLTDYVFSDPKLLRSLSDLGLRVVRVDAEQK